MSQDLKTLISLFLLDVCLNTPARKTEIKIPISRTLATLATKIASIKTIYR